MQKQIVRHTMMLLIMTLSGGVLLAGESAPGYNDLLNATYKGLTDTDTDITLEGGKWQGEPWVPGQVSAPSAQIIGELVVSADLDNDGRAESLNLVNYSGGGTGQFLYLAVSRFDDGMVSNIDTFSLGDRVGIRGIRVTDEGEIRVDILRAGPEDGACCPGEAVTLSLRLSDDKLVEQPMKQAPVRLSVSLLANDNWVLSRWGYDEPVEDGVHIDLQFVEGRFTGASTCNRYFADVNDGTLVGDITVGPVGSTRRACADESLGQAESRFLTALGNVTQFSFIAGELVLTWDQGDEFGALHFRHAGMTDS